MLRLIGKNDLKFLLNEQVYERKTRMERKKISIIVPIYKVELYLERCVNSLINQTYKNIEIILVDDGSPDQCPQMCDNYAKIDSRTKVIHKKNGGLSDARNAGLRIATGEYVMYVDSDDYIEEDSCEKLIESVTGDIDVVVGACKEIGPLGIAFQQHTNLEEEKIYEAKEYVLLSIEKNEWYAPAWLNLYRRGFLIDNNLYYKVGYYFEDVEMLPRLFLKNPTVKYVNYPFYNYVIREDSIMTSSITQEKINMTIDIYSEWFQLISTVSDSEYRNKLYGVLAKYYMANAWKRNIHGWKVNGMNFAFAWKYALNTKEKMKAFMFTIAPGAFSAIARIIKEEK